MVRSKFLTLIRSDPREELLQQFINSNPILFHQFPSIRIYAKAPILTEYVSDFAILTTNKNLLLVEIEKATTRLLTNRGGIAAALTHAFDQVGDWLHIADEYRSALLGSLKVAQEDVGAIRGIVIAGRDSDYNENQLRKLKGADRGRITLLTYDDMLSGLDALMRRMDAL